MTAEIVVRDATAEDLPEILAIYNDVVRTSTATFSTEEQTLEERQAWFEGCRAAGLPVLVAEDDAGAVAGFATYGPFHDWPGYRMTGEHTMHVRSDRRGRGIGHALLEAVLDRARQAGLHAIVAGVDADNEGSILLHERLGFVRAGRFPEVAVRDGKWLDVVFLVAPLER
jgi:L-amino acid N-acyltransferase YncA